jgi:ribonuclease R
VPKKPPRPRNPPERRRPAQGLPSESEILAFVASAPGRVGKRDIARAFGIKGNAKFALKHLLKAAEGKGLLSRSGRKVQADGVLPAVSLVEVAEPNEDGDLIAYPVEWNEERFGARPEVFLRSDGAEAPSAGDRVLVKVEPVQGGYRGQVLRVDRPTPERVVGVFLQGLGAEAGSAPQRGRTG